MHKILAVDDEQLILDILQRFLQMKGFQVVCAHRGRQAIEIINSGESIDLMIVDLKMPEMTGIDVLREIEAMNKKIPIIVLSGSPMLKDDIQGYINGLDDGSGSRPEILCKPMDLNELLDIINRKLSNKA